VVDHEDAEWLCLRHARGLVGLPADTVRVRLGQGISGWVAEHREPLLVEDVEKDPRFARRSAERYTTHSLVSAPLLAGDQLVGVMNVNNKRGGGAFQREDLDLLVAIASQAAGAIANARLHEETLALAHLDPLTRLYNHGHFQRALEREVERAERYGRPVALVLIDVDDFRPYNDRYGHARGDEALKEVADLICAQSRLSDAVGRTGEDAFGVILPETDTKGAWIFAAKVCDSIAAHPFPGEAGDLTATLTVSMGVASYPEDARDRLDLYDVADGALHASKFAGKNRVSGVEDI
jgi:diguanylate cyclase (GGDEF)-like protein